MKATTEDWADIGTGAASGHGTHSRCILELRARIEALEAQAQAAQPAQAEQGQGAEPQPKSLWRRMNYAWLSDNVSPSDDWARVMDAVADWLAAGHPTFATAANALRAEARCTREGCRG